MISQWLILFCYIIFAYGFSNMVVYGSGPFKIFEGLRADTLYSFRETTPIVVIDCDYG